MMFFPLQSLQLMGQFKIDKLQLEFTQRSLVSGKSITIKGKVYYKSQGGNLVTRYEYPVERIVMTNANGEYKDYDVKTNTVTLAQGANLSSRGSLFHHFITGKINDMGLGSMGFRLTDTKLEGKRSISTWVPAETDNGVSKIVLVHENYLPIYMGIYEGKSTPSQKIYYSAYQNVGSIKMPFTITEIELFSTGDSIIERKQYSNPVYNEKVADEWLNYRIPADAKLNTNTSNNINLYKH
jgi:hypothetical protein